MDDNERNIFNENNENNLTTIRDITVMDTV